MEKKKKKRRPESGATLIAVPPEFSGKSFLPPSKALTRRTSAIISRGSLRVVKNACFSVLSAHGADLFYVFVGRFLVPFSACARIIHFFFCFVKGEKVNFEWGD